MRGACRSTHTPPGKHQFPTPCRGPSSHEHKHRVFMVSQDAYKMCSCELQLGRDLSSGVWPACARLPAFCTDHSTFKESATRTFYILRFQNSDRRHLKGTKTPAGWPIFITVCVRDRLCLTLNFNKYSTNYCSTDNKIVTNILIIGSNAS